VRLYRRKGPGRPARSEVARVVALDSGSGGPILLPEMPENKAAAKTPRAKPTKAKAEDAAAASVDSAEKSPAAVSLRGTCTAEKCSLPLRAKGYCRKHFMAWRRGKLGGHHQYKICTKEACRKKREFGSLCAEHAGKADAAASGTAAATS